MPQFIGNLLRTQKMDEAKAKAKPKTQGKEKNEENKKNKTKRYPLGAKFPGIYFTQREAYIVVSLLNGKSIEAMARETQCSKRTLNFYIESMKKMLQCGSTYELVERVKASDLAGCTGKR